MVYSVVPSINIASIAHIYFSLVQQRNGIFTLNGAGLASLKLYI